MRICPVSDSIAKHCNQEEIYCPECQETMYYDEFDITTLVCSSTFCHYEMPAEEPNDY